MKWNPFVMNMREEGRMLSIELICMRSSDIDWILMLIIIIMTLKKSQYSIKYRINELLTVVKQMRKYLYVYKNNTDT